MPTVGRGYTKKNIYHVMSRGVRGMTIFKDREDYEAYISFLVTYINQHKVEIYAYCLMPTHIHLLLIPLEEESMAKCMHILQMQYALYFNRKYKQKGKVWNSRYKSVHVTDEEQFHRVIGYIENNPVKANLVKRKEDWEWSSAGRDISEIHPINIRKHKEDETSDFVEGLIQKKKDAKMGFS